MNVEEKRMKVKTKLTNFALGLMLGVSIATAADEPLPSWNDGPAKQAILAFVEKVTKEGSPDFVPVPERIAVFDNDGTLWAEQPILLSIPVPHRPREGLAPKHPEWKTKEPFASLLKGDMQGVAAAGENGVWPIDGDHTPGMTTEEFSKRERLDRDREASRRLAALYRDGLSTDARAARLSARERLQDVHRFRRRHGVHAPVDRKVYGIPPEQVVGSSGKLKFEMRDGKPVLMKLPSSTSSTTRRASPSASRSHIGRRPIAAFGNSDGDLQMLQWTAAGSGAAILP